MSAIKLFLAKYKAALSIGVAALIIGAVGLAYCKGEGAGAAKHKAETADASRAETEAQMERERAANADQDKRDGALDQKFDEVEKKVEAEYRNGGSPLDATFDSLSGAGGGEADKPAPRKDGVR